MDKSTVLVVEPARVTRAILCDVLRAGGFSVTAVATGDAACEALRSAADLLILGSWLPDGRAVEVLHQWRRQECGAPIPTVVLLTNPTMADAMDLLEAGVSDCLFMPVDRVELLLRVHRVLRRHRVDTGGRFRARVSTEFREPLLKTKDLATRFASQWVTSEAVASLEVLKMFLHATQRMLLAGEAGDGVEPFTEPERLPVRYDSSVDAVPASHLQPVSGVLTSPDSSERDA